MELSDPKAERADEDSAVVADAHAVVDAVVDQLIPLVASRGEHTVACKAGCFACCNSFIRCTLPEARAIAAHLGRPENAAALARFRAKLPTWRAAAGEDVAVLESLLHKHNGAPPAGDPDFAVFDRVGVDWALRGNLCPLNHDGLCDVYPVRPLICRATLVADTAEFCTPGRGAPPRLISHPRLESAGLVALETLRARARRLGDDGRERALPELVARALGDD